MTAIQEIERVVRSLRKLLEDVQKEGVSHRRKIAEAISMIKQIESLAKNIRSGRNEIAHSRLTMLEDVPPYSLKLHRPKVEAGPLQETDSDDIEVERTI